MTNAKRHTGKIASAAKKSDKAKQQKTTTRKRFTLNSLLKAAVGFLPRRRQSADPVLRSLRYLKRNAGKAKPPEAELNQLEGEAKQLIEAGKIDSALQVLHCLLLLDPNKQDTVRLAERLTASKHQLRIHSKEISKLTRNYRKQCLRLHMDADSIAVLEKIRFI